MSRPQGLPQRPVRSPYDSSRESYRPSPPPPQDRYYGRGQQSQEDYGRNGDMYRFRGNENLRQDDNRASYRGAPGSRYERDQNPKYHDYRSGVDRPVYSNGGGDTYRPQATEFSFRHDPPPPIDFNRDYDSYRRSPREFNRGSNNDNELSRPQSHRQARQGRGDFYNERFSRKAAERPFLKTNRAPTPELMRGMEIDDASGTKFRPLEDLSDSDEAEMDVSSDDNNEQLIEPISPEQPKKKQTRLEASKSDGDSTPRWSNPDPYTALPPPDESQRKKKDVVKLIRKARVVPQIGDGPKVEAAADDFISFDFQDEEEGDDTSSDLNHAPGMPGAPTGPKGYGGKPIVINLTGDPELGNRKRTIDDEIKGPPLGKKPTPSRKAEGSILKKWREIEGSNATPWCTMDHAATENMGFWLHKEIMDFYHHVKPTEFEQIMRVNLLDRLRTAIQRRWKDCDVLPFGSFMAGLYLPTADMDVVFCSAQYLRSRRPVYDKKSHLFKFREFLLSQRIAAPDSTEVISSAKVPIVKFVDWQTGLRVDVSFENDTGIIANKTFQDWKLTFPAMPILVTLIKQFLAMRGLNEPVNGGIGGFTVTCLVTSLLQLMPQVQSGNMIPEHHLGEILMEFFDLYGNEFNVVTTAIQFDPPGYVPKTQVRRLVYKQPNVAKFSVIDPNNPSNDIAGGSKNTTVIMNSFAEAFRDLQKRMFELNSISIPDRSGQSILGVIIGGDYSSFDIQRKHLHRLHSEQYEPAQ